MTLLSRNTAAGPAAIPAGTALRLALSARGTSVPLQAAWVRVASYPTTASPDDSWSAWSAVGSSGAVTSPPARYLQYRLVLTTSDPTLTPVLLSIDVNWS